MEYEPFMRKWLQDTLRNNARYTISFLVFCMLGTTYVVWDPLRRFFVELRIGGAFLTDDAAGEAAQRSVPGGAWGALLRWWARWNRAQTQLLAATRLSKRNGTSLLEDFWADRERDEEVAELKHWLTEPQDRVMLLTGHRGNGQSAFVREVLGIRAIYFDVGEMLEAGGSADDQIFLRALCRNAGYWPAQGMDRLMSAMLDLLLPGSGKLSRENEVLVAVQRVLSTVTKSLAKWQQRRASGRIADAAHDAPAPLIVIDGFTSENKDRRDGFFDALVSWAAYISEAQLARVLFIADSSFAEPAILAALRDRPERLDIQQLSDAKPESVRRLLERHFGSCKMSTLSDEELAAVGGRFKDIAALVAHVQEGEEPKDAVRRLIEAAESTTRNLLMKGQKGAKWTRPQLWRAIRLLGSVAPDQGVAYDVLLWTVFRGDEQALQSMKESNLITVAPRDVRSLDDAPETGIGRAARRYKALPGSPLIGEVFWRLTRHAGLAAVLDLEVAKEDIKREQATLEGYESALVRLQEVDDVKRERWRGLPDPNEALNQRKRHLLALILEQHKKLEKYHKARQEAQLTLSSRQQAFAASSAPGCALDGVPGGGAPPGRAQAWTRGWLGAFGFS